MVSPKIQNLAQRLLFLERTHNSAFEGESDIDVAVRVVGHFRGRLIRLAGVHGYRSLLSRALTLAKQEDPALDGVQIGESGVLEGVEEIGNNEGVGLILVAQLLELLTTFIGESLTLQLVRDVWPAAADEDKS